MQSSSSPPGPGSNPPSRRSVNRPSALVPAPSPLRLRAATLQVRNQPEGTEMTDTTKSKNKSTAGGGAAIVAGSVIALLALGSPPRGGAGHLGQGPEAG